jgi:cytochrome c oxidase assembly factor CtaG
MASGFVTWRAACLAPACLPEAAAAHGVAFADGRWPDRGTDPTALAILLSAGLLYGVGVLRLWSRAGIGKGVGAWRVASFAGGLASLVLALSWPLGPLTADLLSAHMAQHIVLAAVAPPLLLLGRPVVLVWALPRRARGLLRGWGLHGLPSLFWRRATRPAPAFIIEAAVLWGWHMPAAVELASRSPPAHAAMHLSFLGGGLLFWAALGAPGRGDPQGYAYTSAASFLTMLHTGFLGALLTFAPVPLYAGYAAASSGRALTALEDQQLAGLLMWIVCGTIYLVATLVLVGAWLATLDRAGRRKLLVPQSPTGIAEATDP